MRKRLLALLLSLTIALSGLTFFAPSAEAAGSIYVAANCQGPAMCLVVFQGYGGSDNYDCWTVRLWNSDNSYQPHSFCNSTWGGQQVQFYIPPGKYATVAQIIYNDGIGAARTYCDSWA